MKNNKWNTKSKDPRDVRVVLFISRNKDNEDLENFVERRRSFITKEEPETIKKEFLSWAEKGLPGEMSRMYISVNTRDEDKIYKELLHFLIDNPDFNLCSIDGKLAGIAAKKENAKEEKWMFDFDLNDANAVEEFKKDINDIDNYLLPRSYKTPHGYAVIVEHGFDIRKNGFEWKWIQNDGECSYITLKRDDLLCYSWFTVPKKSEPYKVYFDGCSED